MKYKVYLLTEDKTRQIFTWLSNKCLAIVEKDKISLVGNYTEEGVEKKGFCFIGKKELNKTSFKYLGKMSIKEAKVVLSKLRNKD